MKIKFPADFWWGGATSGPQNEGRFNKPHRNIFDYWYDTEPDAFYKQQGPNLASNFYNDYPKDIKLLKKLGFNTYRFSIQWTRLIENFEDGTLNQDGVNFYNNVINELIKAGIQPIVNLFHFDLPVELLQQYGGWESKHVVDLYTLYAEKCFKLFGDRVKNWFTFNEPKVIIDGGYLYQFHYPNIVDSKKAMQVAYNLNLASAKAIQVFHKLPIDGKIGIILNLTPAYPASKEAADQLAASMADLINIRIFLDPAIKGEFPQQLHEILATNKVLWNETPAELKIIKENTVDQLGVNYYQPLRVKRPSIDPQSYLTWMPDIYFDNYELPGRKMNIDKNWEIYPKAVYDIAMNLKNNYNNLPWYISENGIGVSHEERFKNQQNVINDDYRINFMQDHLYWLAKAMADGANCFGYHVWTPIDCWSWKNAYRNRYGLISNDIRTQIRTIKKSGKWFQQLTANHGFDLK
jgi:6-phospho-beta-glucosidase